MAVFGVLTKKTSSLNPSFDNRYFVDATSLSVAADFGVEIAGIEETIFGSGVSFTGVHAWVPNATPNSFTNIALSALGDITATTPLASFICARVTWSVSNSYPCYKDYRVQVNSGNLNGVIWASSYETILLSFVAAMEALPYLVTASGAPMEFPALQLRYVARQESKSWYNRTTP